MQAVIDSNNGVYFRCLLENGDLVSVHQDYLPKDIKVGDVVVVAFTKDEKASDRQKELMK